MILIVYRVGYDEEVQNFIGVYPQRFLKHLTGYGVNSFFKPRTSIYYLKKNEAPMSPGVPWEHVFPAGVEQKVPVDRGDPGCPGALVVTPL